MKTIYAIKLTGKSTLSVTMYEDENDALFMARRIDPALEPEIVEYHLMEKLWEERR